MLSKQKRQEEVRQREARLRTLCALLAGSNYRRQRRFHPILRVVPMKGRSKICRPVTSAEATPLVHPLGRRASLSSGYLFGENA